MIIQEMIRRKNMLETMAATDLLPYVRYSRASVIILWLAVLAMPVAIFSTTLLYIVGPAVLLALLFFNLTFIALGSSYIPTEELLDKEVENDALVGTEYRYGGHFLLNSRPLLIAEQNLYNHFPMSAEIYIRKLTYQVSAKTREALLTIKNLQTSIREFVKIKQSQRIFFQHRIDNSNFFFTFVLTVEIIALILWLYSQFSS